MRAAREIASCFRYSSNFMACSLHITAQGK
jgi:hypothetical protein